MIEHPLVRGLRIVKAPSAAEYTIGHLPSTPRERDKSREYEPQHAPTEYYNQAKAELAAEIGSKRAKKKATIAKRPKTETDETDATVTPAWLAERLGAFDFDPCSNVRSHVKATRRYATDGSHTHGTDGCSPGADWSGRGFLNNPWSKPLPWMLRAQLALTFGGCIDLVVLCKLDPGTEWWHTINAAPKIDIGAPTSPEIWHFHKRVQYDEHPAVIERRRLERIEEAIVAGKTPEQIIKITGKSTANVNSVIIHHRSAGQPILELADIADRYVRAFA